MAKEDEPILVSEEERDDLVRRLIIEKPILKPLLRVDCNVKKTPYLMDGSGTPYYWKVSYDFDCGGIGKEGIRYSIEEVDFHRVNDFWELDENRVVENIVYSDGTTIRLSTQEISRRYEGILKAPKIWLRHFREKLLKPPLSDRYEYIKQKVYVWSDSSTIKTEISCHYLFGELNTEVTMSRDLNGTLKSEATFSDREFKNTLRIFAGPDLLECSFKGQVGIPIISPWGITGDLQVSYENGEFIIQGLSGYKIVVNDGQPEELFSNPPSLSLDGIFTAAEFLRRNISEVDIKVERQQN